MWFPETRETRRNRVRVNGQLMGTKLQLDKTNKRKQRSWFFCNVLLEQGSYSCQFFTLISCLILIPMAFAEIFWPVHVNVSRFSPSLSPHLRYVRWGRWREENSALCQSSDLKTYSWSSFSYVPSRFFLSFYLCIMFRVLSGE